MMLEFGKYYDSLMCFLQCSVTLKINTNQHCDYVIIYNNNTPEFLLPAAIG